MSQVSQSSEIYTLIKEKINLLSESGKRFTLQEDANGNYYARYSFPIFIDQECLLSIVEDIVEEFAPGWRVLYVASIRTGIARSEVALRSVKEVNKVDMLKYVASQFRDLRVPFSK